MQSEDDSLWESFPQALETLEGVRRYINAFQAPLQEHNNLNSNQVHALWACWVLAIPPPMERMPPPGGFPKDLSKLNLLGWAALIQDMAAGLQVVPPNLNLDVGLPAMVLLQLLEATTGVGFCHFCCRPSPRCKCMGACQQAPTKTWSQVGHAKALCPDPALLVVKFHSGRWRKDLEHVLKVYYKHNLQAPYRKAEWARVRDRFFEHFLPHKEEALSVKERFPSKTLRGGSPLS